MKCIALLLTGLVAGVLALLSVAAGSLGTATAALVAAVLLVAAGLILANRPAVAVTDEPLPVTAPALP